MSTLAKLGVVGAAIAAAVVLFLVLGGDEADESATTAQTTVSRESEQARKKPRGAGIEDATQGLPRITIVEGEPAGGVQELEFETGQEVRFEVDSDVSEEIHVHGYNVIEDVTLGKPVTIEFDADIEGVFEVELEHSAVQIAELTVTPD